MSKNWEALRDTGPPIVEPPVKHVKTRSVKKPFGIQTRFVGDNGWGMKLFEELRDWHHYNRYKTEKSRDQAFAAITRASQTRWGYRIEPNE